MCVYIESYLNISPSIYHVFRTSTQPVTSSLSLFFSKTSSSGFCTNHRTKSMEFPWRHGHFFLKRVGMLNFEPQCLDLRFMSCVYIYICFWEVAMQMHGRFGAMPKWLETGRRFLTQYLSVQKRYVFHPVPDNHICHFQDVKPQPWWTSKLLPKWDVHPLQLWHENGFKPSNHPHH